MVIPSSSNTMKNIKAPKRRCIESNEYIPKHFGHFFAQVNTDGIRGHEMPFFAIFRNFRTVSSKSGAILATWKPKRKGLDSYFVLLNIVFVDGEGSFFLIASIVYMGHKS